MKSIRYYATILPVLLIVVLGMNVSLCAGQDTLQIETRVQRHSQIVSAIDAMARGDFEVARSVISHTESDTSSTILKPFTELLTQYDSLVNKLNQARNDAYKKYINDFKRELEEAHWRKAVLETSQRIELKSEKKRTLEKEFAEEREKNLFTALTNLVNAWTLADKMDLQYDIDPKLQKTVVDECLQIATELEQHDKGLDAYTKVYGLLEILDKDHYEYKDLHDRLQREVTLEATYIPDPNTEGVAWEDRRKNVNLEMVYRSLAILEYGFVEKPDFRAMCLKGLDYCRILAETGKMKEAFEQLEDEEKVDSFVDTLERLGENVLEIEPEKFDSRQVLAVIERLLLINNLTIALPSEVLLAEFSEGAYSKTDSYTYVIWPYDVEEFRKSMTNEFSGVGVVIMKDDDGVLMADSLVSYDTPAYRAGIDAGDRILKVDGKDTRDITTEKAVKLITGPDGTDVVLTIQREGWDEPRDLIVRRKQVAVPTVRGLQRTIDGKWNYFLDPEKNIGYVQLTHFSGDTAASLRTVVKQLKSQGMRGLVLDLRNNTGGYLSGAIDVVDTFISKGRIVSSRGRDDQDEEVKFASAEQTVDEESPMVVLVNSISASASEIVSGALKDNGRAILIGTRTFGKGSVQTIQPLGMTNAQMKMTIAKYYLPSGRCVHRDPDDDDNDDYGVEPNITMELTGDQFTTYTKTQREAGTLHRDDLPMDMRSWKTYSPQELLDIDPQLEMSLLVLKARLLRDDPVVVAN